jgi:hypothetical protein
VVQHADIDHTGLTGVGGSPTFHGCSIYHNTTENPATPGPLSFNSEIYDTDAYHDTVTNNSRITIPTGLGGKYLVTFCTNSSTTSNPIVRVKKNGTTIIGPNWQTAIFVCEGSVVVDLAAGDYIQMERANSGTLGHASAFEAQSQCTVSFLG